MQRKTTIKDIGRAAGVSPTAVSMALNDRRGVSPDTRRRIKALAVEMGYRPNYAARSLVSCKSYLIGFVINSIADPFYPEMAQKVEETANAAGYSLLLCNTQRSLGREKAVLEVLHDRGVDGVIIATAMADDANIRHLIEDGFCFVLVNRHCSGAFFENRIDYVVADNEAIGRMAIRHLYRLGHERIAVIAGDLNTTTAMLRTRAAVAALEKYGLDRDECWVVECHYRRDAARTAAVELLACKNRPTAFFCQDDFMAFGVRDAVLESGLQIPRDVALIGVDDVEMGALRGVDLSTISPRKSEMGFTATRILIDKMQGRQIGKSRNVVLTPELIVRTSCGYSLKGYRR